MLAFCFFRPEVLGVLLSLAVFAAFTQYHKRQSNADAQWTKNEIYRRLPLACIASPWYVARRPGRAAL